MKHIFVYLNIEDFQFFLDIFTNKQDIGTNIFVTYIYMSLYIKDHTLEVYIAMCNIILLDLFGRCVGRPNDRLMKGCARDDSMDVAYNNLVK